MKKFFVVMLVVLFASVSFGQQYVFSVKSGSKLEEAQFAYVMGNIQPFIGLDYLSVSADVDAGLGDDFGGETIPLEAGASMYIMSVGARMYFGNNPTKMFIFGGFMKSFASLDLSAAGEDAPDEFTDPFKDLLSFTGFKFGLGAEYKIDDHFSVSGEYGFYFYNTSTDFTLEDIDVGMLMPDMQGLYFDLEADLKASCKHSKGLISLNFYF